MFSSPAPYGGPNSYYGRDDYPQHAQTNASPYQTYNPSHPQYPPHLPDQGHSSYPAGPSNYSYSPPSQNGYANGYDYSDQSGESASYPFPPSSASAYPGSGLSSNLNALPEGVMKGSTNGVSGYDHAWEDPNDFANGGSGSGYVKPYGVASGGGDSWDRLGGDAEYVRNEYTNGYGYQNERVDSIGATFQSDHNGQVGYGPPVGISTSPSFSRHPGFPIPTPYTTTSPAIEPYPNPRPARSSSSYTRPPTTTRPIRQASSSSSSSSSPAGTAGLRRNPSSSTSTTQPFRIGPGNGREEAPPLAAKRHSTSSRAIGGSSAVDEFNGQGLDEEEAFNLAIAKSLSLTHGEASAEEEEERRQSAIGRRRMEEEEEAEAVELARAMLISSTPVLGGEDDEWVKRNGWGGDEKRGEGGKSSVADGVSAQDVRDELSRRESVRIPTSTTATTEDKRNSSLPATPKEKPLPPGPNDTAYAFHPTIPRDPSALEIIDVPSHTGSHGLNTLQDPIHLLPSPSALQIIAPSLSSILRDLIARGSHQLEPSPEAFGLRKGESKDPRWECRCWLWFLKCESGTGAGNEVGRRGFRTILVLELVELEDWRNITLQRTTTSGTVAGSASASSTSNTATITASRATPKPPDALRVDDGANPILPPHVSSEVAFADLGAPLILPFKLETLVERLYTLQKMGKTISASAAVPDTGTRAYHALRVWNLIQKYPGPSEGEVRGARPGKKEPLIALGRRISNDPSGSSGNSRRSDDVLTEGKGTLDDGLSVHGRFSKTAAIRKATSKVLGKISSGRADQMDDEREEWITPFVTSP